MRDWNFLQQRLKYLWQTYFAGVKQQNRVLIKFGRKARYQFGCIKYNRKTNETRILINAIFQSPAAPLSVIDHTICHELVHYAHGFSSPGPRLHRYPHQGGVVEKELVARGLGSLVKSYKIWLKTYRQQIKRRRIL